MKKLILIPLTLIFILNYSFLFAKDSTEINLLENNLRITYPNGGEKFPAGGDIVISWNGVSEFDAVRLEYSTDEGNNWNLINDKATGLKYKWENIPFFETADYMIRVSHIESVKPGDLVNTLIGDINGYAYVSWNSDGSKLATVSVGGVSQIWDTNTGKLLHMLQGHSPLFSDFIKWSPDDSKLAIANSLGNVAIWDTKTGIRQKLLENRSSVFLDIIWSSDGRQIAMVNLKSIEIWNITKNKKLYYFSFENQDVADVVWKDQKIEKIATRNFDTVRIWDGESKKMMYSIEGYGHHVDILKFSNNGEFIAIASGEYLQIVDSDSGLLIDELKLSNEVDDIKWSPDDTKLTTVNSKESPYFDAAIIWNLADDGMISEFKKEDKNISSTTWSPNGKRIIISGADFIEIWDVETKQLLERIEDYYFDKDGIFWSPDGLKIASTGMYRSDLNLSFNILKLWDVETGKKLYTLGAHGAGITEFRWHPNKNIIATLSLDGTVKVWDVKESKLLSTIKQSEYRFRNFSWNSNGSKIATNDRNIKIWDWPNNQLLDSFKGCWAYAEDVVKWSPDDTKIAKTCSVNFGEIWDIDKSLPVFLSDVDFYRYNRDLAWSNDGTRVATYRGDTLKIIDADNGNELHTIITNSVPFRCIKWSPDDKYVSTSARKVDLWDPESGKHIMSLQGVENMYCHSINWSSNSKIVSAICNESLIVWDVVENQIINTIDKDNNAIHRVNRAVMSNNEKNIALLQDKDCGVWNAETCQLLFTLDSNYFDTSIYDISWNYNDEYIASFSSRSIKIWATKKSEEVKQSRILENPFSVVQPEILSRDIQMANAKIGTTKQKVFPEFIINKSQWDCRIDTVYFIGEDSEYFQYLKPKLTTQISAGKSLSAEISFSPHELREYNAQLVIVTQADTLLQNITGYGRDSYEGRIGISHISPNPTNEIANIQLNLTEKGNTKLEIYDSLGNHVFTIFNEIVSNPGERNLTESLKNLAIGSYTLVLTTPGNVYTESLKIVR